MQMDSNLPGELVGEKIIPKYSIVLALSEKSALCSEGNEPCGNHKHERYYFKNMHLLLNI